MRLGDGRIVRFWLDVWTGDRALREVFPRMFALEKDKEITVANKLNSSVVSSFRRLVRGGIEHVQLLELYQVVESVVLSSSRDRWVCTLSGDGEFKVKDVRNRIDDMYLPTYVEPTRWVKCIPVKINIFAWKARRDRLPTRANLVRRGITLDSTSCPICQVCEEDASHVFFRCGLARAILCRVCRWWDLDGLPWTSFSDW